MRRRAGADGRWQVSSPSIPWPVIKSAIDQFAPVALPAIADFLRGLGYDLGPIPPDIRADVARVDAEIDAELEKTPDTQPKPPVEPSDL